MVLMKLSMGAGWRCEVVVRSAVRRFGERLGKSEVDGLRPQLACSPNRPGARSLLAWVWWAWHDKRHLHALQNLPSL